LAGRGPADPPLLAATALGPVRLAAGRPGCGTGRVPPGAFGADGGERIDHAGLASGTDHAAVRPGGTPGSVSICSLQPAQGGTDDAISAADGGDLPQRRRR